MGNACRSQGKVTATAPPRPPPLKLQSSVETESDHSESDEESAQRAEERLRRIQTARDGALRTLRTSRALSLHHERRKLHIQATRHKLGLGDGGDVNFGGLKGTSSESESEDEDEGKTTPRSPTSASASSSAPPEKTMQRHKSIFGPCESDPPDLEDSGEAPFGTRLESGPAEASPDLAAQLAEAALAEKAAEHAKKEKRQVRMSVGGGSEEGGMSEQDGERLSSPDTTSAQAPGEEARAEKKKKRAVVFHPVETE